MKMVNYILFLSFLFQVNIAILIQPFLSISYNGFTLIQLSYARLIQILKYKQSMKSCIFLFLIFICQSSALSFAPDHSKRYLSINSEFHQFNAQSNIENPQDHTQVSQYDIVVIGAGIAGVTAASQLSAKGYSVIVLEANDYIGGRMKSKLIEGRGEVNYTFEEGANWIHGFSAENPITQLSKSVPQVKLVSADYDQNTEIYDQSGERADENVGNAYERYINLLQNCSECQTTTSVEEAIKMHSDKDLTDKYFMYNVATDLEFESSGTIDKLSSDGPDQQFEGPQTLVLSGYQRFVEQVANKAKVKILLRHKVNKVSFASSINKIYCENGKVFQSKQVIIAVPLGVLKKGPIKFQPSLPTWKREAIDALGFGNLCKILLDFQSTDFLKSEAYYIGVVSEDVSKRGLGTFYVNFNAVANVSALLTFGLGVNADEAQIMEEDQLKQYLAKRISEFSQTKIESNSFQIYRSSWRTNQNFGGAYSYSAITTVKQDWMKMAKPVFDRKWYFCGEHTISKYRGTVHGAYMSGKQVAASIINEKDEASWSYAEFY